MTTKERFLKDISGHVIEIISDNGINRHIRFRRPGTMCMHFDLITWPGYLCYTGDMGTFVFQRLKDMFQFFRSNPNHRIDFRYWAEKVEAMDKCEGVNEFDPDAFKQEITKQRRKLFVQYAPYMYSDQRQEFWEGLEEVKNSADEGEHRSITKMQDWHYNFIGPQDTIRAMKDYWISIDTCDFPSCKKYSRRFLWCGYAIQWGINLYDQTKNNQLTKQEVLTT